jgi:spermidine/putrescine transport system permease protein
MAAIEERDADGRKRGIRAPWIMLGPGGLWLVLFYALPLVLLLKMSLSSASGGSDFSEFNADPVFNWHWSNFGDALSKYGEQFGRSFAYAGIATVAAMLIAFPIAYVIAFRGGRFKNVFLGLIIIPFLTNYLIRTLWVIKAKSSSSFEPSNSRTSSQKSGSPRIPGDCCGRTSQWSEDSSTTSSRS